MEYAYIPGSTKDEILETIRFQGELIKHYKDDLKTLRERKNFETMFIAHLIAEEIQYENNQIKSLINEIVRLKTLLK